MSQTKPPRRVVSIDGPHEVDHISQTDLAEVGDLQAAEWSTAHAAHRAVMLIAERIKLGATVEDGPLEFDAELGMVRTRKRGPASEARRRKPKKEAK